MSIKPEIRQRILDAAEQLAAEGIDRPTNEQVRERLGGGSLSHISPVMREWRESLKVSAVAVREMPNEIRTVLERVGAELWRSASQLADEEVERIRTESEQREKTANDERDEALREIERLEASITTLREHGHQDEKRIEQLTAENHNLMTENATAKQRAADALERVTDLHNQLARQNEQLETMRGEGGLLRNRKGELFMSDYHQSAELAPRDVVARAIWSEMAKTRTRHVYLDVTHLGSTFIKKRFPTIYKTCLRNDIDITEEWIPVSPSAHYFMGGIKANIVVKAVIKIGRTLSFPPSIKAS